MQTDIRLLSLEPIITDATLRTPLKFGTGVVHTATSCEVRAKVENRRGQVAEGRGHILLSVFWGFPSATLTFEARDTAMRQVAERFCALLLDNAHFGHPMDLYLEAKPELARVAAEVDAVMGLADPMPLLGALVCASPADAALHDAFGNVNGICSYEGYGPEFMAHDLSSYLGPAFAGKYINDYLHSAYKPRLPIFHLVGGLDRLTRSEVTPDDPHDGLPVSLEDWIERDGIRCFKVKLRGNDIDWDVARTKAVVEVIVATYSRLGISDAFHLSTDSNEMNENPDTVVEYLEKLREALPLAFDRLLYLEQPTERDLSAHRFDLRPVAALKPVVVDEGVTDTDKLDLAMSLGWSGVGLKTCKGHSSTLLYVAKAREAGMVITFQDLTNPGLGLIHEAGFAARMDTLMGFEYNARQYLPHLYPEIQAEHTSLFTVQDGMVRTDTLGRTGLGY